MDLRSESVRHSGCGGDKLIPKHAVSEEKMMKIYEDPFAVVKDVKGCC